MSDGIKNKHLPRNDTEKHGIKTPPFCSIIKCSNGGVAVGLPHRNYSVFKQTHINQRKEKGRIRMELRIRKVDEGGGLTGTRASEAKGPFPGGKRVGSWGKKK